MQPPDARKMTFPWFGALLPSGFKSLTQTLWVLAWSHLCSGGLGWICDIQGSCFWRGLARKVAKLIHLLLAAQAEDRRVKFSLNPFSG